MCIEKKMPLFIEKSIIDNFLTILSEIKCSHNCKNLVYIFMPDHLHLILEGVSEKSDLWKTIVLFKQKTGFWLSKYNTQLKSCAYQNYDDGRRRLQPAFKWQKDFYDYIHRKDDDSRNFIPPKAGFRTFLMKFQWLGKCFILSHTIKRHIIYILNNPVRRGLVENWQDYNFKGSLDFDLEELVV